MIITSVLLDKKRYHLTTGDYEPGSNVFSVIIGINGTGKSRLLRRIACNIKNTKKLSQYDTIPRNYSRQIEFIYNGEHGAIYSNPHSTKAYFGNEAKEALSFTPNIKAIAVTTSPFDKFPVEYKLHQTFRHHNNDLYHYIGLRISENSYNKANFLHLFARSLLREGFQDKQQNIFEFLGYKNKVYLDFKSRLLDSRANRSFTHFLEATEQLYRSSYNRLTTQKSSLFAHAYKAYQICLPHIKRGITVSGKDTDYNSALSLLLDMGLVQVKDVTLVKTDNNYFNITHASSGEQCLLLTILNIAGVIRNNSVICIDEPEISLHPEWQKKFMPLLISSFKNYKNCHFIISTHSPLIISELEKQNCFILNMDYSAAVSSKRYINKSADYQLAELFDAPGQNNEYLNRLTVSLLSTFSKHGFLDAHNQERADKLFKLAEKLDRDDHVRQLIQILKDATNMAKQND